MSESNNGRALDALRRLSDEDLARAAERGDDNAASVLLERFEEPLYRYTIALLRDPDLAREATWSALFEGARAVRVGEYDEPVKPWLFKIAHAAAGVASGRPDTARVGAPAQVASGALAEDLASLPDRDRSSLLLRELVGLEYAGIATVTGARPSAARQSVYRARLGMQGDVEPTSPYCDEIRAAMSKAETGIRERRSIATHLESCPVCEEFAEELERRPGELRALFPPPPEPLAAELLPPLPPPRAGAPAAGWERPRRERGRRLAAVPLALILLGLGAGIATAVVLSSGGGGKSAHTTALQAGSTGTGAKPQAAAPAKPQSARPARKHHAAAPAKKKPHRAVKRHAATPSVAAGAAAAGATASSAGATTNHAAPCKGDPATTPAQSGYSGRGGALQAEVDPCAHAASAELASTGLDLKPVIAAGFLLLALGIGLRRLGARV